MFKVECYCDDKDLGKVKRSLASAGAKDVTDKPVANAKFDKGEVREIIPGGGAAGAIGDLILRSGAAEVSSGDLKTFATKAGLSANSYSYFTAQLVKLKLLRKTSTPGRFRVMRAK